MRKLLLILLLLPTFLLAQDSWVNFKVQYDYWAPGESEFTFVSNSNGDTLLYHEPAVPYELLDTLINCNSGDYLVTLYDSFGDGWQSLSSGQVDPVYFKIMNDCQGLILNLDPLTGSFSVLDTLVNINPCAPPVVGCMDPAATNFDPLATINNQASCVYPPCGGIAASNSYDVCVNNGQWTQIVWEWTYVNNNPTCDVANIVLWNEDGLGPFNFNPAPVPNFGFIAGNGQMPPNWSVEYYIQLEFTDGTFSDTLAHTPVACIPGCTDSNSVSYNPWANYDDGSCGSTGAACDPEDREITVSITLDNWPTETSWQVISLSDGGIVAQVPQGDYDYSDIGNTYNYTLCVDTLGFEFIINDTYGDGLVGSSQPGNVVITDCDDDTLWVLTDVAPNLDFDYVAYSGAIFGTACSNSSVVSGCMDPNFQEFDPTATVDDGTCLTPHIYGCIDTNAYNYDPNATMMEIYPTCDYELWIGDAAADGWGNCYIGVAQGGVSLGTFTMGPQSGYSQTFPLTLQTDIPVEVFYFENKSFQQTPQEIEFQTWQNSFKLTNADGVVLMHEGANPFANNGAGALQPFEAPFYEKYDDLPFCGDLCVPKVFGCMDSTAFNYNPLANTDDGSCIPVIYGCTNDLAFNYDPLANTDDGSCQSIITGCMDPDADNYNPNANTDDGSCYYIGCTDPVACNYDSIATINNGCIYPPVAYIDCNGDCISDIDGDGICDEDEIPGCTNPQSINYDPNATDDDGSCIPFVYGCMDPTAFNYDPNANVDNGSCVPVIFGCIDSTALNYDPLANTDNGTCILPVIGCTDPNAYNYDPTANVTDSSACLYDAGCYGGPGVPYWLNDGCYAWVIDVDDYCCTTDWDASCQSMYNYCQNGWPAGLEDPNALGIIVYPNPTNDKLFVDTHLDVDVKVLDMMGKEIPVIDEQGYNTLRIDLSKLSEGAYNLVVIHGDKRYIKRIIKQ